MTEASATHSTMDTTTEKYSMDMYTGLEGAKEVVNVEEYARTTRTCHKKLQEIWNDLELSDIAQEQQLKDITERALGVWSGAVEHAEQHRHGIRARIEEAYKEIKTLAEQLGEHNALDESRSSMGSLLSPGRTLKRRFDEVMAELEDWKRKRQARVEEHDRIQHQINSIREALGMAAGPVKKAKNSITRANMDFLKLELERMRGEKVRRERKMEATLAKLRKLCIELGEDDAEVAASVHPTLRTYHQSMRGHYFSTYSASKGQGAPADAAEQPLQVALSDDVFNGLNSRVEDLQNVKEEREARLAEMQEVLLNMWQMLEISPADENRAFFEKMLQAPARLHSHTLDKGAEEISRLEAEQAKAMRLMIQAKAAEVGRLCKETFLPVPNLSMLIDDSDSPGQVADALSKIVRMLAEVTVIVEQREPIIKLIHEVEEAFKEVHWHFQHQQENLFNNRGRDANRLLQRAIKAEEKKKKLPKLIARLNSLLSQWAGNSARPFVYGRTDYKTSVLALIEDDLEQMSQVKARKVEPSQKNQRPGTAGKPPRDPSKPSSSKVPTKALAAITNRSDDLAPMERPKTTASIIHPTPSMAAGSSAPSIANDTPSLSDAGHVLPITPIQNPVSGFASVNPLQDLVNNIANASAVSRAASRTGSERYAPPPALASLQLDDQVNYGSAAPSPAPAAMPPPFFGHTGENGGGSGDLTVQVPGQDSPTSSLQSRRSVRSEALSHLSMNVNTVTVRKGKKNQPSAKTMPAKSPSMKKSPVPEHSVMHTGMME